jgi:hypothetical protein
MSAAGWHRGSATPAAADRWADDVRDEGPDRFLQRSAAAAVLLAVGGVVVLIAGHGDTAGIAGAVLLSIAAVTGVSLAFYVVGRGEDRDRRGGRT